MTFQNAHAQNHTTGTTEVVAVLIAITDFTARVLTVDNGKLLPSGPLTPVHHSLQAGVRQWVEEQTQQPLGYIEQLYTFVDSNRRNPQGHALIYVSYLGLVQEGSRTQLQSNAVWRDWHVYFPWENHLQDNPASIDLNIVPQLYMWADKADSREKQMRRRKRIQVCWGVGKHQWQSEHALLRYEMLYEAELIPESRNFNPNALPNDLIYTCGEPMYYDHRRVIATAMSRLRAKIEYQPVIFGLMPDEFTLSQLQYSLEALSGVRLHKQNFRRQLENQDLLVATGRSTFANRGRPAQLYRFGHDLAVHNILMDSKLPKLR